jgi:hypothetical protein
MSDGAGKRDVKIVGLEEAASKAEALARFGEAVGQTDVVFIAGNGLQDAAHRAANCLGWIWRQWLLGCSKEFIRQRVEAFLERGLEFRRLCTGYDYVPLHDVYLLSCAIFAGGDPELRAVARAVADAEGDKGKLPIDNGEVHMAAWSGMLKYWILGSFEKAREQSRIAADTSPPHGVKTAPKSLVNPWLERKWPEFVRAQEKDFERLWKRARGDGWTITSENSTEVVVTTDRYQIEHHWCWAHCGLAMLAARSGVDVASDVFWFPPSAVQFSERISAEGEPRDQLRFF